MVTPVLLSITAGPAARADHQVPNAIMAEIMQLSAAAGILSSRSCRDPESAARASDLLAHLIQHLRHSKYFDRNGERQFQRAVVIPRIQSQRTLSHSSRDCTGARATTDEAQFAWRGDGATDQISGMFSLGDWGGGRRPVSPVPAPPPPATALGRR